jgi:hypothetical protein
VKRTGHRKRRHRSVVGECKVRWCECGGGDSGCEGRCRQKWGRGEEELSQCGDNTNVWKHLPQKRRRTLR